MAQSTITTLTDRGSGFIAGEEPGDAAFPRSAVVDIDSNEVRSGDRGTDTAEQDPPGQGPRGRTGAPRVGAAERLDGVPLSLALIGAHPVAARASMLSVPLGDDVGS